MTGAGAIRTAERTLIIMMGVSGAGKSTVAPLVAARVRGPVHVDSERRAFDKRLFQESRLRPADPAMHRAIAEHCIAVARSWADEAADTTFVIDRWYETYIIESGLPRTHARAIERAVIECGFQATIVNLVIADDFGAMRRRHEHTIRQRGGAWWDVGAQTPDERAAFDLGCQRAVREIGRETLLGYREVDTTDMDWERIADDVLRGMAVREG